MTMQIDPTIKKRVLNDVSESITVYRTVQPRSFSEGNKEHTESLRRRANHWSETFKMSGEFVDLGDTLSILTERTALEVYVPSESVWWTDRENAYSEKPAENVPQDDEAASLAEEHLERLGSPAKGRFLRNVSTNFAAEARSEKDSGELLATSVTVHYGFEAEGVQLVGPGARVRASFGGDGELVDYAQFWRQIEPVGERELLHPMQAAEQLRSDSRFAEVIEAGHTLKIEEMNLGHYAAAPDLFQRYLVPVYHVQGFVDGSIVEDDRFDLFVPAVAATRRESRADPYRDKASDSKVFGSF